MSADSKRHFNVIHGNLKQASERVAQLRKTSQVCDDCAQSAYARDFSPRTLRMQRGRLRSESVQALLFNA
jgi:hypothetical protein